MKTPRRKPPRPRPRLLRPLRLLRLPPEIDPVVRTESHRRTPSLDHQLSTINFFMAEITAQNVAKLREMTGVGMMECKKALVEAQGNMDAAVDLLRKSGAASAAKKATREAREGVIAQYIAAGGKSGVLVEVNCETDFVARNENFRAFADEIAKKVAA